MRHRTETNRGRGHSHARRVICRASGTTSSTSAPLKCATYPRCPWVEKMVRPVVVYLFLVFGLRWPASGCWRSSIRSTSWSCSRSPTRCRTPSSATTRRCWAASSARRPCSASTPCWSALLRGPRQERWWKATGDIMPHRGRPVRQPEPAGPGINCGELTAKAHERGFGSLGEVEAPCSTQRHALLRRQDHARASRARTASC